MKPVEFLGDSLDQIRAFPEGTRRDIFPECPASIGPERCEQASLEMLKESAKANNIKLPPPPCGYSTWYHAHASDQDRMAKLAKWSKENHLDEFGLNFLQIDDGKQIVETGTPDSTNSEQK